MWLKLVASVMLKTAYLLGVTLLLASTIARANASTASQCGYNACSAGKPGMLNVHLVPHGHCDTGWLKTVDQYFYGSANNKQNVGIQYNIDAVVQGLLWNKERRFTWIEVAYFWRWWGQQTNETQAAVRKLVATGQLMFGNNAWDMNDEASTLYQTIIDQHTLGQRFLTEQFGVCGRPLTAWQIDTFGHSREFASLLAHMGHDSLYFGRLDYEDRANRVLKRHMETLWHGSDELGPSSDLFAGALYNLYSPPAGFCFSCGDDAIMDDKRLFDYNVDSKVDQFIKVITPWIQAYATNHVLVPMGIDFDYEIANRWFVNQDKLIKYVNARQAKGSKINLLYSSVPCYTYAVNTANYTFPEKSDDYFPYADRPHRFWTGTFTSRPTVKGYIRDSNAFLQMTKQLSVASGMFNRPDVELAINGLARGVAIDINHGQLGGTQRQIVAYDNMLRLSNGTQWCMQVLPSFIGNVLATGPPKDLTHCATFNISACKALENATHPVDLIVYNPLSRSVQHWVRAPIARSRIAVKDWRGQPVKADVMPVTERTKAIPERKSSAEFEVVFSAQLPPMGFTTFTLDPTATGAKFVHTPTAPQANEFMIENGRLQLVFDGATNLLKSISNIHTGQTIAAQIDMRYYTSFVGDNSVNGQCSGAFIFRPSVETPYQFSGVNVRVVQGELFQEVQQNFNTWASLTTRLYKDSPYIELEWTVGPIPFQMPGYIGKEVIIHLQSSLKSKAVMYNDANGRQMMRRVKNYRQQWNFTNTEPVAGNYYPLNTGMFIRDDAAGQQLTMIVDRSQGGSSLRDGHIEVMVHRRLGADDALGTGQALNEVGSDGKGLIARGKNLLVLDTPTASPAIMRDLMARQHQRPSFLAVPAGFSAQWSALRQDLPPNVQLLSLEGWNGGSVLLRLEHPFQSGEDARWSKPAKVDLEALFSRLKVLSAEEMTLTGAMPLAKLTRLKWRTRRARRRRAKPHKPLTRGNMQITLTPMQIRTFVLRVTTM